MNALCIILARAGSKGLPQKNMLTLLGKPVLQYTIEHALGSPSLDRIALSTDAPMLLDLARSFNIDVVERPADLAGDTATVDSAARHAVTALGCEHEHIVILYGNVPVRPADLTECALAKLRDTGCDSVQSVYPVEKNHPFWMKSLAGPDGDTLTHYQPNTIYRRQDLPPVYQLDGGMIAVTRRALFNQNPDDPHSFFGNDRRAIVTTPGTVIDIDTPADLLLAQATLETQMQPLSRGLRSAATKPRIAS